MKTPPRRCKVIACEILFREICAAAAESPLILDLEFLPKGLHDIGEQKMSARLQEALDRVDPATYEAILFGYALCNNGTTGLTAAVPMVLPRAHDCITLLLGSRERYREVYDSMPGTYFTSPGWIERNSESIMNPESTTSALGIHTSYEEYVKQYGEENARFLMESIGEWFHNYKNVVFIDTELGNRALYEQETTRFALEKNLAPGNLTGDRKLFQKLLFGDWNPEDFLVVPPGQTIRPSYDTDIVRSEGETH